MPPTHITGPEFDAARRALLHGVDPADPIAVANRVDGPGDCGPVDWKLLMMFDAALQEVGAQRPQDIEGIEELNALYWFIQSVSPPMFFLGPKKRAKMRADSEKELEWYLKKWGY